MTDRLFARYHTEQQRADDARAARQAEIIRRLSRRNFRKTPSIPDWEVGPGFSIVASIALGLVIGLAAFPTFRLAAQAITAAHDMINEFQMLRIEE